MPHFSAFLPCLSALRLATSVVAQELSIYDNNANRVEIHHFRKYLENQDEASSERYSIGLLPTAVFRYQNDTLFTSALNRANRDPALVAEEN